MTELENTVMELFQTFLGMGIGTIILIIVLGLLSLLIVNALFLRLALYIRKVPTTFAKCIGTAFYMVLANLTAIIPIVGIFVGFFLQLYIIHKRHFVEYLNAFLVWLIAILLPYGIVLLVLGLGGFVNVLV